MRELASQLAWTSPAPNDRFCVKWVRRGCLCLAAVPRSCPTRPGEGFSRGDRVIRESAIGVDVVALSVDEEVTALGAFQDEAGSAGYGTRGWIVGPVTEFQPFQSAVGQL